MVQVTIGPATDEERDWAAALMAGSEPWITLGASLEQCRRSSRDPEYLLYVARVHARPCGAVLLQRRGVASSPYIKSIAVAADYRSKGIGAALMEFAENLFRPEARHIFLCVSSFNTRARAFYERYGYSAVGEFKDFIIEGASEILMHKRLR
jgi:ribosomal protein S18 acetylase RimI-like enzyme